jgi:hypothetical protein
MKTNGPSDATATPAGLKNGSANKAATCELCGSFDALEIGDRKLCAECVMLAGSSCAGGDEPPIP